MVSMTKEMKMLHRICRNAHEPGPHVCLCVYVCTVLSNIFILQIAICLYKPHRLYYQLLTRHICFNYLDVLVDN